MSANFIQEYVKAHNMQKKALASLYIHCGFSTPEAFIQGFTDAVAYVRNGGETPQPPKAKALPTRKGKQLGRRPRLTEEKKAAVSEALKSGEAGSKISERFGLAYSTVHRIKSELGMVRVGQSGRAPKSSGRMTKPKAKKAKAEK